MFMKRSPRLRPTCTMFFQRNARERRPSLGGSIRIGTSTKVCPAEILAEMDSLLARNFILLETFEENGEGTLSVYRRRGIISAR